MIRKFTLLAISILFSVVSFGQVTLLGDVNLDDTITYADYYDLKTYLATAGATSPPNFSYDNSNVYNPSAGNLNIVDLDRISLFLNNGVPLNTPANVNSEPINITIETGTGNEFTVRFSTPSLIPISIRAFQYSICCEMVDGVSQPPSSSFDIFQGVDDGTGNVTICGSSASMAGIFGSDENLAHANYFGNFDPMNPPCMNSLILVDQNGNVYDNVSFPDGSCVDTQQEIEGDVNQDYMLNWDDYNFLKEVLLGYSTTTANTNFNGDNVTNIVDLDILWNHINSGLTIPLTGGNNTTGNIQFGFGAVYEDFGAHNVEITITNSEPVSSFQFTLNGADYNYNVGSNVSWEILNGAPSAGVSNICGISGMNGALMAGTHTFMVANVQVTGNQLCLTNPVAGINGDKYTNITVGNCFDFVSGCTDPSSLTYNPNATIDDGSCTYVYSYLSTGYDYHTTTFTGYEQVRFYFNANESVKSMQWTVTSPDGAVQLLPFDDGTYVKEYENNNVTLTITGNQVALTPTTGTLIYQAQNEFGIALELKGINVKRLSGQSICASSATYIVEDNSTRTVNDQNSCIDFQVAPPIYGCTHPLASNYNTNAQINDGTCSLPQAPTPDGVNVSGNNTAPHHSAVLDLSDNAGKGLLVPKMTHQQMIEIISPAEGLMVYVTDGSLPGLHYYNSYRWVNVSKTLNN